MIRFEFNEAKATQAAAVLIERNGGTMNYMKLMKLLYLADREALLLWDRPITNDFYVSMNKGPVLSAILDKINYGKAPNVESYWHKHITQKTLYNVDLKKKMDFDELSPRETELLVNIFEKYKNYDQWEMVEYCHENLPEWKNPDGTSIPIWIEDILRALDKTEMEIMSIDDDVSNLNYVKSVLS
jgi:uncharacterized phage-associated protein